MNRGDAAAAMWIFRGVPTLRLRRGDSVGTGRGDAVATWMFRGQVARLRYHYVGALKLKSGEPVTSGVASRGSPLDRILNALLFVHVSVEIKLVRQLGSGPLGNTGT